MGKRISTKSSYNPVQDARQAGLLAIDPKVGMILTFTFGIIFATNLRASFYVAALVVALIGIRMLIIRPDLIPGRRR